MSPTAKDILANALTLPESDRAALIASLIDSLEGTPDEDAQAEWQSEIKRRLTELDNGSSKPIPWATARQMILGLVDGPTKG